MTTRLVESPVSLAQIIIDLNREKTTGGMLRNMQCVTFISIRQILYFAADSLYAAW
ncbi:hypothetical protein VCRA2119O48_800002 [Vibrio crassostreae]|nr:hypothetical protein VCRA2119O48_800002 [Vibrio crassostreae]CAK4024951.1 hypothetical protein VCRA212O16_870001 [Vibrio crassostreae]